MLHSQVLIFGYQLAQAAGVRESMSCASRDSGFAELCERFAGSQATEFMEQLGNFRNQFQQWVDSDKRVLVGADEEP